MRAIGMTVLFAAPTVCGWMCRQREKRQVEILRQILRMLELMQTHLRFSALPTEELLDSLCASQTLGTLSFLEESRRLYREQGDLPAAWRQAALRFGAAKPETRRLLAALGEQLGASDVEGQLAQLRLEETLFGTLLERAEAAAPRSGSACLWIGVCAGVMAVIAVS